jgi:hypothetical protein
MGRCVRSMGTPMKGAFGSPSPDDLVGRGSRTVGTFSQRSPIVWKSRGQGRDACRLVRRSSPRFEPHPLSSFRSRSRHRPSAHFRSEKYSKPRQSITITASCWVMVHHGSAARRVHRHRYPVGNNRSPALRVGQVSSGASPHQANLLADAGCGDRERSQGVW